MNKQEIEKKKRTRHEDRFGFFKKLENIKQPIERDDYKIYHIPTGELRGVCDYGAGYLVVMIHKTINQDNPVRFQILSLDDSGMDAFGESTFESVDDLINKHLGGFPSFEELARECTQIGLWLCPW